MNNFTPSTNAGRAAWASFREAQKGETWIFPFDCRQNPYKDNKDKND